MNINSEQSPSTSKYKTVCKLIGGAALVFSAYAIGSPVMAQGLQGQAQEILSISQPNRNVVNANAAIQTGDTVSHFYEDAEEPLVIAAGILDAAWVAGAVGVALARRREESDIGTTSAATTSV